MTAVGEGKPGQARFFSILPDSPALVFEVSTALVRLDMRTVPVSPVGGGPRVRARRAAGPNTGAPWLPAGVEKFPRDAGPVPGDSTTLLGAPVPATLRLAPLGQAEIKIFGKLLFLGKEGGRERGRSDCID